MSEKFVTVPVVLGFDRSKVVGELRILESALPPTPDFVFSIGYKATEKCDTPPRDIPKTQHLGSYSLGAVSIVSDSDYAGYLSQVGVIP